ncbi:MAG: UDP-N-acetylmuramoyl-L-alanine--D-glutamate ligase [Caulobacter vibrioides]|uniref:UDP-N-acetylmuramoylalanine--D-glutamate ligase n=1 Tax=Caulobacter vibrioides TaxID=155892 RepID=A0A258D8N0_CAUVI|nr:MAG: UDP-N-acetylmuramoyl-L-alanine--D-glutamate ligase [Caulobacter vibrioides]
MIPVRGFEGKRVAVFGLARTGLTAARALMAGGAVVSLWDDKAVARAEVAAEGLPLEDLSLADWTQFDALLLSPGVPLTHPQPHWTVQAAQAAGVEIIGDVELFARTLAATAEWKRPKVVAITGTNGKSTTTALLGHILKAAGKDARIGGNIGVGLLGLPDMHGGAVYVLELSSYQLDLTHSLKADVAVLLNISPDHLDRHGGMEGYVAAKRRVFQNQGKGDTAVIGVDDAYGQRICTDLIAANRRTIRPVSACRSMGRGVYVLQGVLYDATGERVVEVADLTRARSLPGRHNHQNAAAAYAAALALGVAPEEIAAGLMSFPGLAHRMEDVGRGGIEPLRDLFPRIEKAYLIGEAALDFARTLGDTPHSRCPSLEAAVAAAHRDAADKGEEAVVLLSPACASFDQFPDFEVRGDAFRAAVQELSVGQPAAARA